MTGGYGGADGHGLIDPDLFMIRSSDIDLPSLTEAAEAISRTGTRLSRATGDIETSWGRLGQPGVYEAPEGGRVHRLMNPAVQQAENFSEATSMAAGALVELSTSITSKDIYGRLVDLESRARTFRDEVEGGVEENKPQHAVSRGRTPGSVPTTTVEWYENTQAVRDNADLLEEYAQILADLSESVVAAAEQIDAIKGVPDGDAEPLDVDALMAVATPWGTARGEDLSISEQGWLAFGNMLMGTFFGFTSLFGLSMDGYSIGSIPGAWKDLLNTTIGASGIPSAGSLLLERYGPGGGAFEDWLRRRSEDGGDFWRGMTLGTADSWDEFKDAPWQHGNEAALAWLMFMLPSANAVKGPIPGGRHRRHSPESPTLRASIQRVVQVLDLVHTGSGWVIAGGIRVADSSGRWLRHPEVPDPRHRVEPRHRR